MKFSRIRHFSTLISDNSTASTSPDLLKIYEEKNRVLEEKIRAVEKERDAARKELTEKTQLIVNMQEKINDKPVGVPEGAVAPPAMHQVVQARVFKITYRFSKSQKK